MTSEKPRPAIESTADTAHPSGEQWVITHGPWRACIAEVGGSLRTLTHDGEDVVVGYDVDARADAARGHVLAPWPNRIRDGVYTFDGVERQLALTEPARHNASHGLTHWLPWQVVEHSGARLRVAITVHPQPGWDWTLRLETTYSVDDDGLTVTPSAHNLSGSPCPFGWGAHPYLTAGEASLDDTVVTAPVSRRLVTDEQLIPVGIEDADSQLAEGLALQGVTLDTCFTGLPLEDDGRWRVHVTRSERTTTLWADAAFRYLQLFTGDNLPEPRRRRSGLAVEPMTCPADAFNSGDGLIVLAPGEFWSASFGITVAQHA